MATKKPRIVIIGAGMAGLTASHKLYTSTASHHPFELLVVEGGSRIAGRINSSEFSGDRIELGATWIHGIQGSPVYKIAQEGSLLQSDRPWECMDGLPRNPVTIDEGGHELDPSFMQPISRLFKNLIGFIEGKAIDEDTSMIVEKCVNGGNGDLSVGSFLRRGLEAYWEDKKDENGNEKLLEEAVFAMHENTHRSYTAVDDLENLDFDGEREYKMFPGEDMTIAQGYSSVIESLASVLPSGTIQLGRKVEKIEWGLDDIRPVKMHFCDGTALSADHVIVTVSLGVLKRGIKQDSSMFNPPLPDCKIQAISKLGFGVSNKVFLQLCSHQDQDQDQENQELFNFPFVQMVFHRGDSELRNPKIPQWIRRTSWFYPIYPNSRVLLSWFIGQEALQLESMTEEEIINGFSTTASSLLSSKLMEPTWSGLKFGKVKRTKWGTDPLFLGSYSYVAVGSSGDDMDTLSEPLPLNEGNSTPQLQILFAGEATDRTHYGTTHAAYLSGIREANRLLKHYNIF